MKFRWLPQEEKSLSCNLPEKYILDVLEKKFEIPSSGYFIDKIIPSGYSSFMRGDRMFRIDKTAPLAQNQTIEIVALGTLTPKKECIEITITYTLFHDYLEMLLWGWTIVVGFVWLTAIFVLITAGWASIKNSWLFIIVLSAFATIPFWFREFLKGEIEAVHSKIVWSLKNAILSA